MYLLDTWCVLPNNGGGVMNVRIRLLLMTMALFLGPSLHLLQAAEAAICYYAGLAYSEGACDGGQRCSSSGTWVDDKTCKSAEEL
jgi:hypothetical protein